MARNLTRAGTSVCSLSRVFWRYTHGIKIKFVLIGFCIPKDHFITSAESSLLMLTVSIVPNNSVPKLQPEPLKNRMKNVVQRCDGSVVYIVPHLPTDASCLFCAVNNFGDNPRMPLNILV